MFSPLTKRYYLMGAIIVLWLALPVGSEIGWALSSQGHHQAARATFIAEKFLALLMAPISWFALMVPRRPSPALLAHFLANGVFRYDPRDRYPATGSQTVTLHSSNPFYPLRLLLVAPTNTIYTFATHPGAFPLFINAKICRSGSAALHIPGDALIGRVVRYRLWDGAVLISQPALTVLATISHP